MKDFAEISGVFSLENQNNPKGDLYLKRSLTATSGDDTQRTTVVNPGSISIAKQNAMPSVDNQKVTAIVAFDTGRINTIQAVNGSTKEITAERLAINFNKMTIGGEDVFSTSTGQASTILTRLVIYERNSISDEITKNSSL